MTDFSWNRAARLPLVSLTDEERAAGWPAAFTLENFASMQFPMDGDESARRTARKARTALLVTLREAIAAGELPAEERRREVQRVVDDGRVFEPIPLASSPRQWFERTQRARLRRTITEIETRHAITREAAAEFLAAQGIEPSEHIRAWGKGCDAARAEYSRAFDLVCRLDETKAEAKRLRAAAGRTTGQERESNIRQAKEAEAEVSHLEAALRGEELPEAHQGKAAKPKRETQADRIARCVSECERRAAAHGEPFDRERMPGTKAEFLDLLHALDAGLRSIKTVDSLDRYLSKTGCKWPFEASAQPNAAPLYARLFPEARIRTPGAVSPQRRKA